MTPPITGEQQRAGRRLRLSLEECAEILIRGGRFPHVEPDGLPDLDPVSNRECPTLRVHPPDTPHEEVLKGAETTDSALDLRKSEFEHPSGKYLLKDEKLARLSPQEERILSLVADCKTNREIGDELNLAEKTVKNYVSSILSKLEVARRAAAASYLARHTTTPRHAGLRSLQRELDGASPDQP